MTRQVIQRRAGGRNILCWLSSRRSAVAAMGLVAVTFGPFDMPLFGTAKAPAATGTARLVFAQSPFGIALTRDGHASYDIVVTAEGMPDPSTLGAFTHYVAWAVTTDLGAWRRLGTVHNGTTTVGRAELNKFLFVITAEAAAAPAKHRGPTILHGTSPSGWLQTFLSHPLFRGLPP